MTFDPARPDLHAGLLDSWHTWQHAYFATRPRRGLHPAVGINGAVLGALTRLIGYTPHLPVPDPGRPCRFCPIGHPACHAT